MKTITIRLPDVEAAMLEDLRKRSKPFASLDKCLARIIRDEYKAVFGL